MCNRHKLGGLYKVLHNFSFDLTSYILITVLWPSLKYGCEVWNTGKFQAKALESIQLCACKYILWCSFKVCDEPVCADLGLETLKSRRDLCKLKWYCKMKHVNEETLDCYQMSGIKWRVKAAPKNVGLPMLIHWRKNQISNTKSWR